MKRPLNRIKIGMILHTSILYEIDRDKTMELLLKKW